MDILNYLLDNGAELLLAIMLVLSIIVKRTPSIKDDKIYGYLDDLVSYFIKNKVNDQKEEK